MSFQNYCKRSFLFSIGLCLFLGFAYVGLCDELLMVSVPLGFEISSSDKTTNWVSENKVFSFGFLEKMGEDNDGFIVGIRYNLGGNDDNIPVWSVGGGVRVSINSTFRLSMEGKLILIENPNGLVVWSSNTSNLGVAKATLLNNGNLVLMGVKDEVIWESFDKPTNTLLPGQSLVFPQTLRAPSTKLVSSYYSFMIRRSGELALMWQNNVTYWRSRLFSSSLVKEARFDGNGVLGLYGDGDTHEGIWHVSSKEYENPDVVLRHLRIDSDGNLRMYYWDNVARNWKIGWQAVENQCEVFGYCGLYSICGYNSTGPVCDCLYSDPSNLNSGFTDSSNVGCKQMVDLGNCKMHTSMLKSKQTVLYGMYPPLDVELFLSENACKEYCSNDTACVAATSKNDGSGLCTIKRTSFISGFNSPSVQATSFLKVCLVPQAVSARGADTLNNTNSIPKSSNVARISGTKFIEVVALIVLTTVLFIVFLQFVLVLYICLRRKRKARIKARFGKNAKLNPLYSFLARLSFEEIQELTNNFVDQIGPYTFKGVLPNKALIITKILNSVIVSEKDFRMTVSTLGGMHHRNLVPLKGFCFEPKHKILLYEYVPNGSLDKWIFEGKSDLKDDKNWQQRLDIALGVARGIAYLHTECQQCVAHGDLKAENVLLDENLVPKLTYFGIRSLVQTQVISSSESQSERDIFMLGEMLLQIVTCKKDTWGDNWLDVIDKLKDKNKLLSHDSWKGVERVVRIALWCTQNQPFLRPSIGEVVKVLEGTLSVDRSPPGHETRMEDNGTSNLEGES